MTYTDISEKGLETLIVSQLISNGKISEPNSKLKQQIKIPGYVEGSSHNFDKDHAVDIKFLLQFIASTQPKTYKELNLAADISTREKFLHRLQGEIAKRGIIDVLRNGVQHNAHSVEFFFGTPHPANKIACEQFAKNIFSITRQLHFSKDSTKLSLDLVIFINGLPIITFELKNKLTKQTVDDAVNQYKRDRDPKELLFQFGRCMVHLALDDHQVMMCTHLKGKECWFLPFNKGYNDGAGNPPNPDGIATDYLWKEVLQPLSLSNIIENYAQIVEEKDEKTGKKKKVQIFPRYHQLDVVKELLSDALKCGVGQKYLIQHSAGSGKSNSIAWLSHQLIELKQNDNPIFDSVIVVTDRKILDKQIRENIKRFAQVSAVVGGVTQGSQQLKKFIRDGKKIIISTVQKFPFILKEMGSEHRNRKFAIIIDEAHSSQGGRTSAKMNIALSKKGQDVAEETFEDKINRLMEARKMLTNASYFAFTATPKNKTLEIFGIPYTEGEELKHKPFHHYTMKQAIEEGFIIDVLKNYTPVDSWYHISKKIKEDPQFDAKRALKKMRRYVESHDHAIKLKAEIMVDHFHEQVIARRKIDGKARAMVITSGINRAIQYFHAFETYLRERKSPYRSIIAFSGKHEYDGKKVTEASLNKFPSGEIADKIVEEPYRFLIVADKFQTGYDEPLLHTMYVDKQLSSVKAVQTLSRLNRAHPKKHDTFVLDFMNDIEIIKKSFEPYYRTTILSEETDPNKLHDLKSEIENYQVFNQNNVDTLVKMYLSGIERDKLDPILDVCVKIYTDTLDEDGQVNFKSKSKVFVRVYNFLSSILPYTNAEWEKLSIFLNFLVPKLPAPIEIDLSKGILETIDMDSYRVEAQVSIDLVLLDTDGEIDPVPTSAGGAKQDPIVDLLSNIIKSFNENFGNIQWRDGDKVRQVISEEIPRKVAADEAYQNARQNSDKNTARFEHDKALQRVMSDILTDNTELFKQFSDNPNFKKWLSDMIFTATYVSRDLPQKGA